MDVSSYWKAVLKQDPELMREFFRRDAFVNWHNTNEHFNLEEFIKANCEYPGSWDGEIERMEEVEDLIITVAHIWSNEDEISFHVTSFIQLENNKIKAIDEYWSEDGIAPGWRTELKIGSKIK